jgi:hypothetical protein
VEVSPTDRLDQVLSPKLTNQRELSQRRRTKSNANLNNNDPRAPPQTLKEDFFLASQ